MKKFEILCKLPTCDTDIQSEQTLLENGANRPIPCRAVTNLQFVKNTIFAKHNKWRYACDTLFLKLGVNTQMFAVIFFLHLKVKDILQDLSPFWKYMLLYFNFSCIFFKYLYVCTKELW